MSAGRPASRLISGVIVVGLLVVLAVAGQRLAGGALGGHAETHGAVPEAHAAVETEGPAGPTKVEELPCFGCHNLKRYLDGEELSHEAHEAEDIGHCHMCHAFEGHFEVTIRQETCEECH